MSSIMFRNSEESTILFDYHNVRANEEEWKDRKRRKNNAHLDWFLIHPHTGAKQRIVSTKNLFATSDNQYFELIALAFSNNLKKKHNLLFSECVFVEHLKWL